MGEATNEAKGSKTRPLYRKLVALVGLVVVGLASMLSIALSGLHSPSTLEALSDRISRGEVTNVTQVSIILGETIHAGKPWVNAKTLKAWATCDAKTSRISTLMLHFDAEGNIEEHSLAKGEMTIAAFLWRYKYKNILSKLHPAINRAIRNW